MIRTFCKFFAAALMLLSLGACSQAASDNRRADSYADRLEQAESVSALEYAEIVAFYCDAIDRALAEVASDTTATDDELHSRAEAARLKRPGLTRLGNALFTSMPLMPDSTRHTLISRLGELTERYAE